MVFFKKNIYNFSYVKPLDAASEIAPSGIIAPSSKSKSKLLSFPNKNKQIVSDRTLHNHLDGHWEAPTMCFRFFFGGAELSRAISFGYGRDSQYLFFTKSNHIVGVFKWQTKWWWFRLKRNLRVVSTSLNLEFGRTFELEYLHQWQILLELNHFC